MYESKNKLKFKTFANIILIKSWFILWFYFLFMRFFFENGVFKLKLLSFNLALNIFTLSIKIKNRLNSLFSEKKICDTIFLNYQKSSLFVVLVWS